VRATLTQYRPFRPLWMWWRLTRSRRVWLFRWRASLLQYKLRNVPVEEIERGLTAAFEAIKAERKKARKRG
jgi:hypothetical protein